MRAKAPSQERVRFFVCEPYLQEHGDPITQTMTGKGSFRLIVDHSRDGLPGNARDGSNHQAMMNTITGMEVAAGGAKVAQRITGHPNPSP